MPDTEHDVMVFAQTLAEAFTAGANTVESEVPFRPSDPEVIAGITAVIQALLSNEGLDVMLRGAAGIGRVPPSFLRAYGHIQDMRQNAVQRRASAAGPMASVLDTALRSLTGQLEGIRLAWHFAAGEQDDSDHRFLNAYVKQ